MNSSKTDARSELKQRRKPENEYLQPNKHLVKVRSKLNKAHDKRMIQRSADWDALA
jgi:hypothetical protein